MASDPSYVRLAERVSGGMCVDLTSGWGVSGEDVRKFPKDDQYASEFARTKLRAGILEEAGKAEWDAVHDGDIDADVPDGAVVLKAAPTLTESQRQHALKSKRAALVASNGSTSDGEDDSTIEDPEDTGSTSKKTAKK